MSDTSGGDWQDNIYMSVTETNLEGRVLFQNIRSMRANFNKLKDLVETANEEPLIIALSEIWSPLPWQENLHNYHKLEKRERQGVSANKGGGVGFFIHKKLECTLLNTVFLERKIETLTLIIPSMKIAIINCYRAPGKDITFVYEIRKIIQQVKRQYPKFNLILGGDLNININNPRNEQTQLLLDCAQEEGLVSLINSPTRVTENSATTIDLIFSSRSDQTGEIIITDISDHLAVSCQLTRELVEAPKDPPRRRQLQKDNIADLNEQLLSTSWDSVFISKNPCREFYKILLPLFDTACPNKRLNPNKLYTPIKEWMNPCILETRRSKIQLHKQFVKDRSLANKTKFVNERNKYNKLIRSAKRKYLENKLAENTGNGRYVWEAVNRFLNRKTTGTADIKTIITPNGKTTDKLEMAKMFNVFYANIGKELAEKIKTEDNFQNYLPPQKDKTMAFREVEEKEIIKIVIGMKAKKSTGHDDMSNDLLKKIITTIIKPLTFIINHALTSGKFPNEWKLAKVVPIYKGKGAPEDCSNYRPISLLPTMSKVIEKVIEHQIRNYMNMNLFWMHNQYGFRKHHETNHAVIKAINAILNAKKQGEITIAVFMDLKKAFDTVNHKKLLMKIKRYGIPTELIKSYLEQRTQFTTVGDQKSKKEIITCGVPQGSILGPLFFLLYINDIADNTTMNTLCFADDTTFLVHGQTKEEVITTTNAELEKMAAWFKQNALTVHPAKTKFMVFNGKNKWEYNGKILWDGNQLERVGKGEKEEVMKYVGINIDEDLNFKKHGDLIAKKITQNTHLISCNKNFLPMSTRLMIYNALIRPYLDYGAEIWGSFNVGLITKLQKKCIRHVIKTENYISHTNEFFLKLNTPKFIDIIKYHNCRLAHKLIHLSDPKGLWPDFPSMKTSRLKEKLQINTPAHNKDSKHTLYALPKIWNTMNTAIMQAKDQDDMKEAMKSSIMVEYRIVEKCSKKNCPSCIFSRPLFTKPDQPT